MDLAVSSEQDGFVAPNTISIAQAYVSPEAWPRAIYAGDAAVGFVMLSVDTEKPEYWVWRLMIGSEHQGKGYGRSAMQSVIEHVRGLPSATEPEAELVPKSGNPQPFYDSLGFELTGQEDEGEQVMRLAL